MCRPVGDSSRRYFNSRCRQAQTYMMMLSTVLKDKITERIIHSLSTHPHGDGESGEMLYSTKHSGALQQNSVAEFS